ncbi:hypothetical protein Dacsa_3579 [Dactylococcopsis salina PCC 8305]|uniref:Uncharacterized protein n=1 Tax=Dactylococcopsis salina (strain PCC 8305) TaxID=13035 RepID=K9YYN3_DACS8|nr:hypothetical protein Dacsa_3579 [Dactylococcopsis salina PCC 8305]
MILEGHPILLLPIAYCNRAIVEIFYLVPPVGKLKVLPNKDLRRLSSGKNASSLIVQSSKSCLLPLAFCLLPFASCLLPLALLNQPMDFFRRHYLNLIHLIVIG